MMLLYKTKLCQNKNILSVNFTLALFSHLSIHYDLAIEAMV